MWGEKINTFFQSWVRHSESVDGSLINPTCALLNLAQIGRCSTFPHPEVKHYKCINSRSKWKQNQAKVNSVGEARQRDPPGFWIGEETVGAEQLDVRPIFRCLICELVFLVSKLDTSTREIIQ